MDAREALRIYELALDLQGAERASTIDEQTAGDAALRGEVERLLQAAERAERSRFLAQPLRLVEPGNDAKAERGGRPSWPRIDRYRLLELLGEGGFGTVYRAEQLQPVHRIVALKLMRSDRCEPSFIRRFEFERQTLARLNHPGIAQIFDAGTTADGDPYLAMEWVPGEPITDYCDRHRLNLRERVAVMIRVCAAVQHAHQKGVIHRDLKPPNVLVTDEDGRPAPKVIDFGIARAADLRIDDSSLETGGLVGSPMYMSPEQLDPQPGGDVDTRSDVYSLGVLLYELLCGQAPFAASRGAVFVLMRQILQNDPPRPSLRASDAPPADAQLRGCSGTSPPRQLAAQLAGELDWIVLKAMDKCRERRYETAAALAADLQRYLADQPIEARPPSRLYRLAKLVRRNRLAAAASGLLVLSLLLGAIGISVAFWQAQQQAARAQQTVALLQEFLASPAPSAQGKDLTVVRLLESFAGRIDGLADAEIQADLLQTYAQTYLSLGLYDPARGFAERNLVLNGRLHGAADARTLAATSLLGAIALQAGDYARSAELQRQALDGARRILGEQHLDTVAYAVGLGEALSKLGRHAEAVELHRYALPLRRLRLGDDHPETLHSINRLSLSLFLHGERVEAEQLAREAVERRVATVGADHPGTLDAMSDLAYILGENGHLRESAQMDREILQRRTRVLGLHHRKTLVSMNNLAWVLEKLGQYEESEALYRQALEALQQNLDEDSPEPMAVKSNLAMVLLRRGDLDGAEALTLQALAQRERVLGAEHPSTLVTTANLVEVLAAQGRVAEALTLCRALIERTTAVRGADHDATLSAQSQLSRLLAISGDYAQAEALARRILPARLALSGPEREATRELQLNLASALIGLQQYEEAGQLAGRVARLRSRELGEVHPGTLAARALLQQVQARQ